MHLLCRFPLGTIVICILVGCRVLITSQDDQHPGARCPQRGRDAGCWCSHGAASGNWHGVDTDSACPESKEASGKVRSALVGSLSFMLCSDTITNIPSFVNMQVCAMATH